MGGPAARGMVLKVQELGAGGWLRILNHFAGERSERRWAARFNSTRTNVPPLRIRGIFAADRLAQASKVHSTSPLR